MKDGYETVCVLIVTIGVLVIPVMLIHSCSTQAQRTNKLAELKYTRCMEEHKDHKLCTGNEISNHTHSVMNGGATYGVRKMID